MAIKQVNIIYTLARISITQLATKKKMYACKILLGIPLCPERTLVLMAYDFHDYLKKDLSHKEEIIKVKIGH